MEERRKSIRRQHDRELLARYQALLAQQGEEPGKEARKRRRWAIRHNCKVKVGLEMSQRRGLSDTWTPAEHAVKGRILDLSLEGCSLFTRGPIDIGQRLHLVLQLQEHETVDTRGVARWTKAIPAREGYATGVQFETLSAKAQNDVMRFLKEMDETAGL